MNEHSDERDAAITRVEMYLNWTLDEPQKAFLRSVIKDHPGLSTSTLARVILNHARVIPPGAGRTGADS